MKKTFWALGTVVVGLGLFGLGWISHGGASKAPASPSSSGTTSVAATTPSSPGAHAPTPAPLAPLVSPGEFQQLHAARDAVMQANPDLAAEYKAIIGEMQAQQVKLDADMIKVDPKVAPIVAKLVELRQRNGGPSPTPITR